jgi:hypothetical protein
MDDFITGKKQKDAFKKQEGVPYEEEEIPECVFFVKETIKVKDFGNLFLSNYKLSFQPNVLKDTSKLAYFVVPYGYIHRVTETQSDSKGGLMLHILCKDDRQFKFQFEGKAITAS